MFQKENKDMPFGWAVFCLAFLFVSMIGSVVFKMNIQYGGKICISPTVIMMLVGVLIASWIASGTVPTIIYWGLKLINPSFFLVTASLLCAIVAIAIGSSWSTAGTVGVALMGIGLGLGINPAMTAGAILSGSYLGDKMSPMSDTTNLAPAVAEADLFDHIRSMMFTTVPAFVISLVIYGILGMQYGAGSVNSATVDAILDAIQSNFSMNPLVFLPPVIVIVMAVKKCPSIPTLVVSAVAASVIAVAIQGTGFAEILSILKNGFSIETGFADFDRLVNRGGLGSMLDTAALGLLGMLYGAIMDKTGMLNSILSHMKKLTGSVGSLITVVILANIILLATTASQTLAIVVGGRMFISEFRKKNLLPQVLSRTLEDSGTIISPLIPWSLCGVYMAETLGVSTVSYLPFSFFCWLCPVIAIIYGFTGKFVWKTGEIKSQRTYAEESAVQ